MKYAAIIMIFGSILGTVSCDEEADIGLPSPVTCADGPAGKVTGTVTDPFNGNRYEFGEAQTEMITTPDAPTIVSLEDGTLFLRFYFLCGSEERGSYDIHPGTGDFPNEACPLAVGSNVLGQIEILPAESGLLVVDENEECFAGRFDADFGEYGALSGWFSVPLPVQ